MKMLSTALLLFFLMVAPVWSQTGKPSSPAELASYTGVGS